MKDKKLTMLFVYNTNNIKYYYNIASFFKMFGFIVGKYKPESYMHDLDKIIEDYNSVVLLDMPKNINTTINENDYDNISKKLLKELIAKDIIELKDADIFTASCKNVLKEESLLKKHRTKIINVQEDVNNNKDYIDVVKKILNNLVKRNLIESKNEDVLLKMYKIYQEKDLAITEYFCEKYGKIKEVSEQSLIKFLDFEKTIFKFYEAGLRSNFLDYARCYSIYLAQSCYSGDMQDFKIDLYRVFALLDAICEKDKNFISARKLTGQLYELKGKIRMMRDVYEIFLKDNENKSYNSDILLRIGKNFKNYDSDKQIIGLFSLAYSLDNDNYDALRYYAYCLEKIDYKNNVFKVFEYYENQIEILEKIKAAGHMEVEEYKALLMVYFRSARLLSTYPFWLSDEDKQFKLDYNKAANYFNKIMNLLSEPEMYDINFFSNTNSEHKKILTYQKELYNSCEYSSYWQANVNYQECQYKLQH